jgi:catechol 2,3-dioxygenase-like lactoylglutathione lyase family enzyme
MLLGIATLWAVANVSTLVPRVDAIDIVVRDIVAERRFYVRGFGFAPVGSRTIPGGRIERLALGNERLELVRFDRAGAPIPRDARSNDRAFQHVAIIVSDMRRAWERVERAGIEPVSAAPQVLPAWNPNAGGIAAVYFRDPEGHPLELLHFPAGKGAPQWHATAPLFLGIDHTALAVADTAASTRFYEALGFAVRGHSNNYGIEQERLSGVRGAHVSITALRFAQAPGVEFLHYVRPQLSQAPESARPFDLIATRTVVVEVAAAAACRRFTGAMLRPGGCLLRDPDGHFVEVRSSEPATR